MEMYVLEYMHNKARMREIRFHFAYSQIKVSKLNFFRRI